MLVLAWAGLGPVLGEIPRKAADYRQFALQFDGEAGRGRKLFLDESRLACAKCHSIDGQGTKAGPDLFAAGDRFSRREIIDAILQPSAAIAVGYGATLVETKAGEEFQGVLKQSAGDWIELAGAEGRRRIAKAEIARQRGSAVSLMPEGLEAGLTQPEFADLIEYLVTLKEPGHSSASVQGMPDEIRESGSPVSLRPFLHERLRLPQSGEQAPAQSGLVWFAQTPGCSNLFLAVNQAGVIWSIGKPDASERIRVFADLRREVFSARGPNGLLGLAFHPQFRTNRKYYLKHQVFEAGEIATVLVERAASPDFLTDSGTPSRRLLKIPAGAEHHNGGCIQFGPDGFLYMGMGDSAPNHDPQGHGQDLGLLLGKMLRLDVDRPVAGLPYRIPGDNPFLGQASARPEIWACGFREPWRFSFDAVTGDLWVGDLGQERGDEVDIVRRGENHGWNVYEGFEMFSHAGPAGKTGYVAPVFATRRKQGSAIVGGEVYRGDPASPFYGAYIFGDHISKRIWALTQENRKLKSICQIATSPGLITGFSADREGNMYVTGLEGMVYRMDLRSAQFRKEARATR